MELCTIARIAVEQEGTKRSKWEFPVNSAFNMTEFFSWYALSPVSRIMMNAAGDPFGKSELLEHKIEREVIIQYARQFDLEEDQVWGFVGHGSTDGILQGMLQAREIYKSFPEKPVVYCSADAHFSILKAASVLSLEHMIVPTDSNGRMIRDSLYKVMDMTRPAILMLTYGSKLKGAIDDYYQLDFSRISNNCYVHIDAALFGGYLPHLKDCSITPSFKAMPKLNSISFSIHKFYGSPVPIGIFVSRKAFVLESSSIPYLGKTVPTVSCSRSFLNILICWWIQHNVSAETLQFEAKDNLRRAEKMNQLFIKHGCTAFRNQHSNTVVVVDPPAEIVTRLLLTPHYKGEGEKFYHLVIMQQHTDEEIENVFVNL